MGTARAAKQHDQTRRLRAAPQRAQGAVEDPGQRRARRPPRPSVTARRSRRRRSRPPRPAPRPSREQARPAEAGGTRRQVRAVTLRRPAASISAAAACRKTRPAVAARRPGSNGREREAGGIADGHRHHGGEQPMMLQCQRPDQATGNAGGRDGRPPRSRTAARPRAARATGPRPWPPARRARRRRARRRGSVLRAPTPGAAVSMALAGHGSRRRRPRQPIATLRPRKPRGGAQQAAPVGERRRAARPGRSRP